MTKLLDAGISALGAIIAVALAFAAVWLNAFGSDFPWGMWLGNAIIVGFWILLLGAWVFGTGRHLEHPTEAFGSAIAIFVAVVAVNLAVTAWVFAERGQTTTCSVLRIDERVETSTDSEGNVSQTTYYHHGLQCAAPEVTNVTTTGRAGAAVGDQIAVHYDPEKRLGARFDDPPGDRDLALLVAAIATAIGALGRAVSELRPGRRSFFTGLTGLSRIGFVAVASGIAFITWIPLYAAFYFTNGGVNRAYTWLSIDRDEFRDRWYEWLVSIPLWAVPAAAAAVVLGVLLRFWMWVLATWPSLDRSGDIREVAAGFSTSLSFDAGWFFFSFDTGFLGGLKDRVARWFRRER